MGNFVGEGEIQTMIKEYSKTVNLTCPRCENDKCHIEIKKLNNKGMHKITVSCLKCGLKMSGTNEKEIKKNWSRTKDERLKYAVICLRRYKNVYVGKRTRRLLSEPDELIDYLKELTGLNLIERKIPNDEGIIIEKVHE